MTTTAYQIPFSAQAQTFRITLGTLDYQLTQRFSTAAQAWVLDVDDADGNPLVHGLLLITGADLLSQFKHLGIPGQMIVQTDGSVDTVPDYQSMGASGHVYYVVTT